MPEHVSPRFPILSERPLLFPLVSLMAGISLAGLFHLYLPPAVLPPLLAAGLAVFLLSRRLGIQILAALLLIWWGNGYLKPLLTPEFPPGHVARLVSEGKVVLAGTVDRRPETTERGFRVYLQAEQAVVDGRTLPVSGRVLLYVKEGRAGLLTGDRIRFVSRLRKPRNLGLPGEFDTERYLALRSVHVTGFVPRADQVTLVGTGGGSTVQRHLDRLATRIGEAIDRAAPMPESSVLRALLIGDSGRIPGELKDGYTRSGVNHILSISGFHVGVLGLVLYQLLMLLARRSELLLLHLNLRRLLLLLTLPLLVFYLFLSGAGTATVRSVIMLSASAFALFLERETDPINMLTAAALGILSLFPPSLFDLSFQLSFLALWGILLLTPLFMKPFEDIRGTRRWKMLALFMASAAAIIATLLPVAFYFHRVSVTGLLSNFLIVPLMGYGAVVAGFGSVLMLFPWEQGGLFLLSLTGYIVRLSNLLIELMARVPLPPPFHPSRLDLLLFLLLLAVLTFARGHRLRLAGTTALGCGLAASLFLSAPPVEQGMLEIRFLSVGQGESTLVRFPDGRTMLIDGGGSYREGGIDVGQKLLAPALWTLGVKRIDWMVLTHPHPDHLQGLKYVAANFPVGEFWESRSSTYDPDHWELHRTLWSRQVPVRYLSSEVPPFDPGGFRIEPLAPFPAGGEQEDEESRNEQSLVFRLVAGKCSVLFAADIGFPTEELLCRTPHRLKSSILKVPHHGSRYSSSPAFLDAVAPDLALISAGYGNSFRLPAPDTVEELERRRIRVLRTDLDGTILLKCRADGTDLAVSTWEEEHRRRYEPSAGGN